MTTRFASDGRAISLLSYGAMRLPTVDGGHANSYVKEGYSKSGVDRRLFAAQIRRMLDAGINYFDTSPAYCRGESEAELGLALSTSGYARDRYVIATKLSNFAESQYPLAACKRMFENSLRYLKTDYIDNYLLHSVGNGGFDTFSKRYLKNGALDWCCELRAQRKIRNLGFSYHGDPKAFEWCLEHHDKYKWDFVQIQMNYVDWRHAKQVNERNLNAEYLYNSLASRKIPIVVMEPLLGGRLARYDENLSRVLTPLDPNATLASWALRFCATYPGVMTILSGMTRTEHIDENVATLSPLKELNAAEFAALERAAVAYLAGGVVPCNSCNYCMPCPYGLDIPALLVFRNDYLVKNNGWSAKEILAAYAKAIPEPLRRADHCTGCDKCRIHCPQQIDVAGEIAAIDAMIDTLKGEALK